MREYNRRQPKLNDGLGACGVVHEPLDVAVGEVQHHLLLLNVLVDLVNALFGLLLLVLLVLDVGRHRRRPGDSRHRLGGYRLVVIFEYFVGLFFALGLAGGLYQRSVVIESREKLSQLVQSRIAIFDVPRRLLADGHASVNTRRLVGGGGDAVGGVQGHSKADFVGLALQNRHTSRLVVVRSGLFGLTQRRCLFLVVAHPVVLRLEGGDEFIYQVLDRVVERSGAFQPRVFHLVGAAAFEGPFQVEALLCFWPLPRDTPRILVLRMLVLLGGLVGLLGDSVVRSRLVGDNAIEVVLIVFEELVLEGRSRAGAVVRILRQEADD